MLLRTLAAFRRGERRVCSMVHPPLPADEDRRRAGRERAQLLVQATSRQRLRDFLGAWHDALARSPTTRARWSIDVDPLEF